MSKARSRPFRDRQRSHTRSRGSFRPESFDSGLSSGWDLHPSHLINNASVRHSSSSSAHARSRVDGSWLQTNFDVSLLGRRGVGKSTLTERWQKGSLSIQHTSNCGFDLAKKLITLSHGPYTVNLFDNPGAKRFCGFAGVPLRMSHAVIFVVNVTVRKTFDRMSGDLAWFSKHYEAHYPVICIVASKIDLVGERKVSSEELSAFAASRGYHYFEVCSLTGLNVEPLFQTLAQDVYYRHTAKIPLAPITALASDGEFQGIVGTSPNFDFSELLFPGQFTDLEFVHELNGLRISLHKDLLALHRIQTSTLERLARIDFPRRVFWHFFRSLYGSQLLHYDMCFMVLPSSLKDHQGSKESAGSAKPSTSPAAPPVLSFYEKATDLIRLAHLFSIVSLRRAVKWAESVLAYHLLPELSATEKVNLLAFTVPFALKTDQFMAIIAKSLRQSPEALLKEIQSNTALMQISKTDPALYGSLIFSMTAPQAAPLYEPIPIPRVQKMDEWLKIALQRAWKPVFLAERRHRSSSPSSSSSSEATCSSESPTTASSSSAPSSLSPHDSSTVAIYVESYPQSRFIIPDWLIWTRWKALQPRIAPRSSNATSRSICLSNSIDHNALELIIQYLYDEDVTEKHYSNSTCADVLRFGADLGLYEASSPTPTTLSASSTSPSSSTAASPQPTKHFAKLIKLCRTILNAVTIDNCLHKLQEFAPTGAADPFSGPTSLELEQTIDFLVENVQRLEASPTNLQLLDTTQEATFKHIFIKRMQAPSVKVNDWENHQ